MQVTLYEFVKRENSTKRPATSTPSEVTGCVLKEATSIIRPTLVFTGLGNPTRFNYIYIEELGGRYYFIEDWVSVQNRWECNCTVDVLASFKTEIGGSTEYILRSSAEKDGYVIDQAYVTTSDTYVEISEALNPFSPGINGMNSGHYILGIVTGAEHAYGGVGYYVFTASEFRALVDHLYSDSIIEDAQNYDLVKAQTNPIQYIVSAKWFPEGIPILTETEAVTSIRIGWWTVAVSCRQLAYPIANTGQSIKIPKHPQSSNNQYLNNAPYSRYSLMFTPFGEITIDPSLIYDKEELVVYCSVDLITGVGIMSLAPNWFDDTPLRLCDMVKGYVGVDVKLAQVASNYGGALMSVIGGALGAAAGAIAGGWAGAISGISGAVGNAIDNLVPSVSTTGGTGGIVDCSIDLYLKGQFSKIVQTDNARLGSPLCKIRKISNIPGYIVVHDADFRASCTAQENVMIKDYMEGGFFYE